MEIDVSRDTTATTISPKGRLDAQTSAVFEPRLAEVVGQGSGAVIVDMSELDYVSSAGLRVLLMAAKTTRQGGGRLALAGLNETITQVFDISGFTSLFDIHATSADARAALA